MFRRRIAARNNSTSDRQKGAPCGRARNLSIQVPADGSRSSSSLDAARYPRLRYPASRLTAIFASIGSFPSIDSVFDAHRTGPRGKSYQRRGLRDDKACFGRTTFSRSKAVASGRPKFLPPIKEKEVPGQLTPAKTAGNQIPVVNRLFTPSGADIAFGVFARAVGEGSAAIQVDGKLIGRHP